MVLEMRALMRCLPGMQGVRKQVDFIKEKGNKYRAPGALGQLSSEVARAFKRFLAWCPRGTCLESLPFPLIHLGPICGGFQLQHESPAWSAGWLSYRRLYKHSAHAIPR